MSYRTSSQGDWEIARVGRPAMDYKIVVRPLESGMKCMVTSTFCACLLTIVCVCVCVCVYSVRMCTLTIDV